MCEGELCMIFVNFIIQGHEKLTQIKKGLYGVLLIETLSKSTEFTNRLI